MKLCSKATNKSFDYQGKNDGYIHSHFASRKQKQLWDDCDSAFLKSLFQDVLVYVCVKYHIKQLPFSNKHKRHFKRKYGEVCEIRQNVHTSGRINATKPADIDDLVRIGSFVAIVERKNHGNTTSIDEDEDILDRFIRFDKTSAEKLKLTKELMRKSKRYCVLNGGRNIYRTHESRSKVIKIRKKRSEFIRFPKVACPKSEQTIIAYFQALTGFDSSMLEKDKSMSIMLEMIAYWKEKPDAYETMKRIYPKESFDPLDKWYKRLLFSLFIHNFMQLNSSDDAEVQIETIVEWSKITQVHNFKGPPHRFQPELSDFIEKITQQAKLLMQLRLDVWLNDNKMTSVVIRRIKQLKITEFVIKTFRKMKLRQTAIDKFLKEQMS